MLKFSRLFIISMLLGSGVTAAQPSVGSTLAQQNSKASSNKLQTPITKNELQRFMAVRKDEKMAFGESFSSLQNLWVDIRDGNPPSFLQVTGALRDIGGSLGDAKAAQKAGLLRENLSCERYNDVRSQINRALGVPGIEVDKLFSQLKSGDLSNLGSTVDTESDPKTKALIEPYRTQLLETAALGLVGL